MDSSVVKQRPSRVNSSDAIEQYIRFVLEKAFGLITNRGEVGIDEALAYSCLTKMLDESIHQH